MNKTDLINAIATQSGLSKVDAHKAVDSFIKVVAGALQKGDKVSLVGFGSFSVVQREARQGINPSTKEAIEIPAKKVVKFKVGAELADYVE